MTRSPAITRFAANLTRLSQSRAGRAAAVLVVLICLALTAAHPAMFGSLPKTDDGEMHFYRLVALDHAVQQGIWWPRYVPGMAFGYGMPVFNYYSPVSLYPMELLRLAGMSFVDAFLAGTILYILLGLAGAYLLGEAWGGPLVGLVTAVAYSYAPYTLVNLSRRGSIAESLGLALLVWTMWALRRLSQRGRRLDYLLAAGCFSLLILTHNITALYGAALLLAYGLLLWLVSPDRQRTLARLALALALPLGLSAFFWVPALFETGYVFIDRVSSKAGDSTFHQYFVTLGRIFSPPFTADPTRIRTQIPISTGWVQVLLALLGMALIAGRRRQGDAAPPPLRHWLWFAAPLIPLLIFLMTRASTVVWETIPLLPYLQFPWRLLGPLTLLLAVLAGAGVMLAARRIAAPVGRAAWAGAALLALIISGLPWLYGTYLPEPQAESIRDVQRYERRTGRIGGTAAGEYLPRWAGVLPDPDRLASLYAQSEVIPRLQPAPGVTVEEAAWDALGAELTIRASQPATLVFDWLYFPGWWARLDGEQAPIAPTAPHGLISVAVPPGEHTLALGFGPTPLRRTAGYASLGALALLGAALAAPSLWRHGQQPAPDPAGPPTWQAAAPVFAAAALAGLLAFAIKAAWIDHADTPIRRTRFANGVDEGLQTPVMAEMGGMIRLLGFDLPLTSVRSGESVPLTLYWTLAGEPVEEDMSSTFVIRDAAGVVVWQTLAFSPANEPTKTWEPGLYVQEPVTLAIPPGTPPGSYTVQAGIYSHSLGRNLDVLDAGGNPVGVLVDLTELVVTRPPRAAALYELGFAAPRADALTDAIMLVGVSPLPPAAQVGQRLPLIWAWQATSTPQADVRARLIWLTPDGEVAARSHAVPLVTGYPTEQWQQNDVWRGQPLLYVPGSLEAGDYGIALQLYDLEGAALGERAILGRMAVSTPPRTYSAPPMDSLAGVSWQNGIRLLGYDLPGTGLTQGDRLSVTFYWDTSLELVESLTVFVHLIDANNEIAAQRDQRPANGTRPTTGWAPGEIITDAYGLHTQPNLPPGEYRLRIGWYNATTNGRIPLADGESYWLLPEVITVGAGQ